MRDPAEFAESSHPLSTDPIAEQVANIHLPEQPVHRRR
jgi:arginine-tRNA-protein transferase